jgi:hypothetical protein
MRSSLGIFWKPGSATRLGWSRYFFYAWCLVQTFIYRPWNYATLPEEFWQPPFLFRLFPAPTLGVAIGLTFLTTLFLLTSALGLFTRFSVAMAAPLLTLCWGMANSYGETTFHLSPLVLVAWVLAFSRCGDAVSLDAKFRGASPGEDLGEYEWPIVTSQLILVLHMFQAGLHKLQWGWLGNLGERMESILLYKYSPQAAAKDVILPDLVWSLAQSPTAMLVLGALTLIVEVGCPLALLPGGKWLRLFFVGGLFLMQLCLALWSTLATFPWLALYFFWVPWPSGTDE